MKNQLQTLNYQQNNIRMITLNGEPWWVAKDVCDVFGETNRNRAMQALEEDEKGYTQVTTPGGLQNTAIVNESGLYSLLFAMQPAKSRNVSREYIAQRKENLRSFRRWVTHDVLPSIRRTGSYTIPESGTKPANGTFCIQLPVCDIFENYDELIRALNALQSEREENERLLKENKILETALNGLLNYTAMKNGITEERADLKRVLPAGTDKESVPELPPVRTASGDTVRDFLSEFQDKWVWNLVPMNFLYDLYIAWHMRFNPSAKPDGGNIFRKRLVQLIAQDPASLWTVTPNAVRTAGKMSPPEPLIIEYNLINWKNPGYAADRRRGIIRRIAASA